MSLRKSPLMLLLSVLLCAVSVQLVRAQARGAAKGELLFDFRTDLPAPPSFKLPSAEEQRLLDATFRRRLRTSDQCAPGAEPSSEEDLAGLREAGQIAPSVYESVRGSFTAPGREETLHLVAVGECGDMPRVLGTGTTQLVVRAGGKNVVSINGFYGNVVAVRDVDGDGADELLMKLSGFGQGVLEESATVVSLLGGRYRSLHDFESVFVDSCGMRPSPTAVRAGVLRFERPAAPGGPPRFHADFYATRCHTSPHPPLKAYRFLKSGKLYD